MCDGRRLCVQAPLLGLTAADRRASFCVQLEPGEVDIQRSKVVSRCVRAEENAKRPSRQRAAEAAPPSADDVLAALEAGENPASGDASDDGEGDNT